MLSVFKRACAGGAVAITDVSINPNNDNEVYACDDNQVFRSIDGGTRWSDITGHLPSVSAQDFRTLEFIPDPSNQLGRPRFAVGTRSGVYVTAMPDVLVFDMRYFRAQNLLVAGTLGRGVYTFQFTADTVFRNGFE